MSVLDVVIGGGITLAGTVVTQLVAVRTARGQRRETRRLTVAEYERQALNQLQEAAKDYRSGLVEYHDESQVARA